MIHTEETAIQNLVVHKVGNKANEEGIQLSSAELRTSENIKALLLSYFLQPFKSNEYFNFYHDSDINLNEVYVYASQVFNDPSQLYEQSVNIAKHLYEQSVHPKIKSGELYVAYFSDCMVDGELCDALGIFKSENKDTFLKVYPQGANFSVEQDSGININKLDKGCLIFRLEKENGFVVSVVDSSGKGSDAQYWTDGFLRVRQRNDSYAQTRNVISLYKSFVTEHLPEEFDVSRAQQADLLNQSAKFFKEKESFNLDEFAQEVIQQPDIIDSFKSFKTDYTLERDFELPDDFSISESAVKKQARVFKSVIKLDKNFHIYIHGNRSFIEKGYDAEAGMHYYRLLFKEEL